MTKKLYLVKVKVEPGVPVVYNGKTYQPGEEFEFDGVPGPFLEVVEEREVEDKTTVSEKPIKQETTKKVTEETEVKADVPKVLKTPEGTEIVSTFEEGMPLNPTVIKQHIKKIESTKPIVEETEELKPANEKFAVQERGGNWYDVVDLETGNVLNDKAMRRAEAEKFKASLYDVLDPK